MSRFRGDSSRSPYRTPPRLYETQRDALIEEDIRLKSALRAETQNRRIHQELAMLQVKVRHTNELEDRCQSLLKQNNQLSRDNDELSRLLNEKKYELQRIRATSYQQNQRESIKNGQLYEMNKSLQLQIDMIKKERIQSNRLYEAHITKIERMLDQKVAELDSMTLRCSDLSKELQLTTIRFEQEKNRLKNLMTRTQHELQRELEYTKQKTTSQKFSEIDNMKRNHSAQVAILEDEISKLKILNTAKTDQFESQLNDNRALRKRHQQQVRALVLENDELRERIRKLEQMNRSQVEDIQVKYNKYHNQGTNTLKQQYSNEIKILLDQIMKQKYIIDEKNSEIRKLFEDRKELKRQMDETQLELSSEIESLKNKIYSQQQSYAEDNHNLMFRINSLCDQLNRESESYHTRAKDFSKKISNLQAQVADKQNNIEKIKGQAHIKQKQLQKSLNQANSTIQKTKRQLEDSELNIKGLEKRFNEYKDTAQQQISQISKKLSQTETKLEETQDKLARQIENSSGSEDLLNIQIESLKNNVQILQEKLSNQQNRHNQQMKELSSNINEKVKSLQASHKKSHEEIQATKAQQIQVLNSRIEKLNNDKKYAESELQRYIKMYEQLQKYFKDPHQGALFEQRSQNSIYEVLSKTSKSSIHIF